MVGLDQNVAHYFIWARGGRLIADGRMRSESGVYRLDLVLVVRYEMCG
jgi:hypothetical protein